MHFTQSEPKLFSLKAAIHRTKLSIFCKTISLRLTHRTKLQDYIFISNRVPRPPPIPLLLNPRQKPPAPPSKALRQVPVDIPPISALVPKSIPTLITAPAEAL